MGRLIGREHFVGRTVPDCSSISRAIEWIVAQPQDLNSTLIMLSPSDRRTVQSTLMLALTSLQVSPRDVIIALVLSAKARDSVEGEIGRRAGSGRRGVVRCYVVL